MCRVKIIIFACKYAAPCGLIAEWPVRQHCSLRVVKSSAASCRPDAGGRRAGGRGSGGGVGGGVGGHSVVTGPMPSHYAKVAY